jgi:dienelactone hydrolase
MLRFPPARLNRLVRGVVCLAAVAAGASAIGMASPRLASQRVTVRGDDGSTIAATWYEPSARPAAVIPAVIMVHMLQRSGRDWDPLAARLAAEGIGALAVDLRGHGDTPGSAADYAGMVQDLRAARRYLAGRGDVAPSRVGLIGASFGATLAVQAAAEDAAVATVALLSPSLDYRGVRIDPVVRKYGARPLLLVASDDDGYASRSIRDLQKAGGGVRETGVVHAAGHGTAMLAAAPDLPARLVEWFRRTLL